jgi:catechol 2,3-dioxygenase-like lactoylglutathione lyase family enzyme
VEGGDGVADHPVFNQINLVVKDMASMVEFYERLGVRFTDTVTPWDRHHRTFASDGVTEGFDFDLDSQSFVVQWDAGWPQGHTGAVLGFRLPSSEAVDETYRDLTGAGYFGQQPPWDGFMGARYAVVADPDGNSVGLMGPIDPGRSRLPSPPED